MPRTSREEAFIELCLFGIFTQKNEVGFDGQRSLLHLASKLTSFGIEAYFIFFCAKNRVCGLTICDLTILVDHFKRFSGIRFS